MAGHSHQICCNPAFSLSQRTHLPSAFVVLLTALCGYHSPSVMIVCSAPACIGCFCERFVPGQLSGSVDAVSNNTWPVTYLYCLTRVVGDICGRVINPS
eukprot:4493063-Heterocapsa_arctica.AAC.1